MPEERNTFEGLRALARRLPALAFCLALAFAVLGVGEAVRQRGEDEYVRNVTQDVLRGAQATDTVSKAAALRDYLRTHVRNINFYARTRPFLRDTAADTLRTGKGRCGEAIRAVGNMARAAGIRAQRLYLEGKKSHVVALISAEDGSSLIVDSADRPYFADIEPLSELFFFFKQKTAYEILIVTGVQTCALPISCWPRSIERGSIRPSSRSSSSRSEAFFRITCSTYPFSRFWSSTLRSLAVKTSTGMSRQSGRWRISTRNSNPSISGITRSSTITSGDDSASCSSAKRPLLAPATCPFSCSSTRRTPSRMLSSSSTSRTLRAIGLLMFCSSLMRRSRSIGLVMYSVAPSE